MYPAQCVTDHDILTDLREISSGTRSCTFQHGSNVLVRSAMKKINWQRRAGQ